MTAAISAIDRIMLISDWIIKDILPIGGYNAIRKWIDSVFCLLSYRVEHG